MAGKALALTAGEPAGIGPDLCVQIAQRAWPSPLVTVADPDLLRARAAMLGLTLKVIPVDDIPAEPAPAEPIPAEPAPQEVGASEGDLEEPAGPAPAPIPPDPSEPAAIAAGLGDL